MSKKNSLTNLQQNFANHIFNQNELSILNSLPYSNQEALARLNIYRNNVFGNFSSVLSSIFEATKEAIGEEKFNEMVKKFCVKFPSENGNLDEFGIQFPQFLKKIKPAFIADLANLELLYHQSYFAADAKKFDVEKFKKIAPENFLNLRLKLHPSCFLLKSKSAIFSLWKSIIERKNKKLLVPKKTEFLLVDRANGKSLVRKLSQIEFIFLTNLQQTKNLYETYKKICRLTKKHHDIGQTLRKFIKLGVIVGFEN